MLPTLSKNNRSCSPSERCDWLLLQLAKLVKAVWLLKHCVDKAVMLIFLVLLHRGRKAAWGKATVQYLVLPYRAGEGSEGCTLNAQVLHQLKQYYIVTRCSRDCKVSNKVEPLYKRHSNKGCLSNEDTVCCSNHTELYTNLPLSQGHLSIQDSQLGPDGVLYREVPLYWTIIKYAPLGVHARLDATGTYNSDLVQDLVHMQVHTMSYVPWDQLTYRGVSTLSV